MIQRGAIAPRLVFLLLSLAACGRETQVGVGSDTAALIDREDDVDAVRLDVFVVVGGTMLQNPIGFCRVEPCQSGETLPGASLFNVSGGPIGLTWGQFQAVTATSRVSCRAGSSEVRLSLGGLVPGGVYSIFYRTFGPDSANRFCPNEERSRVVPEVCNGAGCPTGADSEIVADARGGASYKGRVEGVCLVDATTVPFDVIYHSNGVTYGELPNQLESQTQLQPCASSADCPAADECNNSVCQPIDCAVTMTCRVCFSSFGRDAHRQAVIVQKAP